MSTYFPPPLFKAGVGLVSKSKSGRITWSSLPSAAAPDFSCICQVHQRLSFWAFFKILTANALAYWEHYFCLKDLQKKSFQIKTKKENQRSSTELYSVLRGDREVTCVRITAHSTWLYCRNEHNVVKQLNANKNRDKTKTTGHHYSRFVINTLQS